MSAAMPTLAQFKRLARSVRPIADAVLMARAYAQVERERVDAYIAPIFASYGFTYGTRLGAADAGKPMTDPRHLYLCDDDERVADYFEACDRAHRAHGFTGPHGHCPALVAEHLVIKAERALIEATCGTFGLRPEQLIYGEERTKYLDIIIGAALKEAK